MIEGVPLLCGVLARGLEHRDLGGWVRWPSISTGGPRTQITCIDELVALALLLQFLVLAHEAVIEEPGCQPQLKFVLLEALVEVLNQLNIGALLLLKFYAMISCFQLRIFDP